MLQRGLLVMIFLVGHAQASQPENSLLRPRQLASGVYVVESYEELLSLPTTACQHNPTTTAACDFTGKTVEIHCNGNILDAKKAGRLFYCSGPSSYLKLKGCTLFRGFAPATGNYMGGAIQVSEGVPVSESTFSVKLEVLNCRFESNIAATHAGAISFGQGKLIIRDSTFVKNFCTNTGGAINAGYTGNRVIEIMKCQFDMNIANQFG